MAVTAQSALNGLLSPARLTVAGWWTVEGGGARDVLALTGLGHEGGLAFGALWLVAALFWAGASGCASGAGSAPWVWV